MTKYDTPKKESVFSMDELGGFHKFNSYKIEKELDLLAQF